MACHRFEAGHRIRVEVSSLDDFEKSIYVRDLDVDPGVTVVISGDELLARVMPPRVLEEFEVAPVKEEEIEGEVEAEGEAEVDVSEKSSD